MPATWPPVRPLLRLDAAVGLIVDEEVGEGVDDVNNGCMLDVAITGSTTPLHLVSVSEKTQQESVELGELAAQYEHKLPVLDMKPQLLGSLATPSIHEPLNESAGSAQFVKSARIWLMALGPAVPQ